MTRIVIVGGGTGGVVAANVLRRELGPEQEIVLLDRKDKFIYAVSYPLLIIGKRKANQISRNLQRLSHKGINVIRCEVKAVNPHKFQLETDKGAMEYDYLILSPGVEHHPETVPGFLENAYNVYDLEGCISLNNRLKTFREGKIIIFISSLPFACPVAPYEIGFLLDDYFRNLGFREKIKILLVTPEPYPEPLAHPSVGESIRRMMEKRRIGLIISAKVLSLDSSTGTLNLDQGITIEGDLFLGIPSHWGPSFLANSGLLDEGGWLEVDPHTLETRNRRVYGIGDATSLRVPVAKVFAPKAGIFAHYQAEVVARNIALIIRGEKGAFRFKGKGL